MRRGAPPALAALTIFSLFHAWGCGQTAVTAVPDGGAPIEIGCSIALSGDLGLSGGPIQKALRVAEQQVNANGGILGRHVVYKVTDDASDHGPMIGGLIKGLLDEGSVAILGPRGSSQVLSVQEMIAKRQIIEISGSATSPSLSDVQPPVNRFLFRTIPPDTLQGKAVAILAVRGPPDRSFPDAGTADAASDGGWSPPPPTNGCTKMSIVHMDDAYGNPFADAASAEFLKRGGQVLANLKIPSDLQASYQPTIDALVAAKAQCLVLITYDPAGDELVHELRKAQSSTPSAFPANFFIIGSDGVYKTTFISNGRLNKADMTSPTEVEGIYGTNPDPNPQTAHYGDFRNIYLTQFELDPGQTDLPGKVATFYDAAILTALAIQRAGTTTDPIKIRDSLFAVSNSSKGGKVLGPASLGEALSTLRAGGEVNYDGASGPVDFDEKGDVVGNYIVWKVQNASFTTVQRIKAEELN